MVKTGLIIESACDSPRQLTVLKLHGEITSVTQSQLRAAVSTALEAACPRVVMNMHELYYIDSVGLGVLLQTARELKAVDQGGLALASLSPSVRNILLKSRLEQMLDVYPDVPQATGALS